MTGRGWEGGGRQSLRGGRGGGWGPVVVGRVGFGGGVRQSGSSVQEKAEVPTVRTSDKK